MEWVWINFARHLEVNIKEQIMALNCHLVKEITPKLLTMLQQKVDYLKDIEKISAPLARPVNVNNLHRRVE